MVLMLLYLIVGNMPLYTSRVFDFNKTGSVRFEMRMKLDSFFEFVFY